MALATTAAATAAALYLDAKYHIRKDVATIRERNQVAAKVQKLAKQNRLSAYYQFEEQVLQRKDAPCLWYRPDPAQPAAVHSWTQTYDSVHRYAHFLLDQGVRPGDLVGSYLINSPDFIHNLLAIWAVGASSAMINYNLAGDGLIHCLKIANSKILIVDSDEGCQQRIHEVREKLDELGIRIVVLDEETQRSIEAREPRRPDDSYRDGVTPASPLFLLYTSGTTGLPKACALPTAAATAISFPRLRSTSLQPGDVWYDCMPFYHGTGGTLAVTCLLTGVTLAIGRKFSVRNFWRDIHDSSANAFAYVGETARYLLAAPPSPLDKSHKVRAMFGNGLRVDVWEKFRERFGIAVINEFFNSSEGMLSMVNVSRGPFHTAHVGHHGLLERRRFHNMYIPVEIDHDTGNIWRDPKTGFARRAPYEQGGEILVACKSTADFSYWNDPASTEKRFIRDVFRKGDVYYRTGDALRRDPDGRWFFMDRLGDTFRWKSENVSTAEVAEVLGHFDGIVEANVYGVELPSHDGRAGCAAVYIRPEMRGSFDYAALLRHARKGLPRYAVPIFLRLVEAPSLMHNGKQSKVAPRKEGVDPDKIAAGDSGKDHIVWSKPGAETYVPFTRNDWNELVAGRVRL
ncbi:hypothetical protein BST61_g4868 [Cercospora zeina]